jgi:hypothetical protein
MHHHIKLSCDITMTIIHRHLFGNVSDGADRRVIVATRIPQPFSTCVLCAVKRNIKHGVEATRYAQAGGLNDSGTAIAKRGRVWDCY